MKNPKKITRDECFGQAASILDSQLNRVVANDTMAAASALAQAYIALGRSLDRDTTLYFDATSS